MAGVLLLAYPPAVWNTLKVGAGGFMTGIDMTSDGVKVCRTDAYGAYVWNGSTAWVQTLTTNSMPAGDIGPDFASGANEIVIAPSNTNRLYMNWNGWIFISNNRGSTWTRTAFTQVSQNPSTDQSTKAFGPYMAVDPANADVIFFGPPNDKAWVTINAGASWTQISTIATPSIPSGGTIGGGSIFKFVPGSVVSGGRTQEFYISVYGTGVYYSNNAGSTYTLTPSTPTTHRRFDIGTNGILWMADNTGGSFNYNKYTGGAAGTWSQPAPAGGGGNAGQSVAVDPANNAHVIFVNQDGTQNFSTDTGANWTRITTITRSSADIPWLATTNESFFSNGDAKFDPSSSNKLYVGEGIGIWFNNPGVNTTWTAQSVGIENLIGNIVLAPPSGNPVVLGWDRPIFYISNPAAYTAVQGPNTVNEILHGWSGDYVYGTPTTLATICNDAVFTVNPTDQSAASTDGGQNWTVYAGKPASIFAGGSIAAGSTTNWLWAESSNGRLYRTTDGGANWSVISITGIPTSGAPGFGFAYYVDRQIVCPDRVTAGTFYMYNSGSDTPATATGMWKSTDLGANWTRVFSGEVANFTGFAVTMKTVPGNAGHLFFTAGPQSGPHPSDTDFMRSTDGGANWSVVTGFKEVTAFGFGATYPGQSYPSIYAAGWNNSVYGIWRSVDNAVSWTKVGDYPTGIFATIKSIDADKTTTGLVYVATATGWFYGRT